MPYVGPGHLLSTVVFQDVDGLPRDEVEMSFAVHDTNVTTAGPTNISNAIQDFLNTAAAGATSPLASYLSPTLSRAAGATKINTYNIDGHLNGSPHGTPVAITSFTLGASGSANEFPGQIAACLSYHADTSSLAERLPGQVIPTDDEAQDVGAAATHTGTARLKSRGRGRIFFGPLCEWFINNPDGTITTRLMTDLVKASEAFLAATAAGFVQWSVWSRADATLRDVTGGWVENEFATQRRRRERPTVRTLWP